MRKQRKKSATILAFAAFLLAFVSPTQVLADEVMHGTVQYEFNTGYVTGEGGCTQIPWVGTVDFDGDQYAIVVEEIGDRAPGMAFHYFQEIRLYDADLDFDSGVLITCPAAEPLLVGEINGTSSPALRFTENGRVTGASGSFEAWIGHVVHSHGEITVGATGWPSATGVLDIH